MNNKNVFTLDRTVRLIISVAVVICLYLLTRRLSGVLLPFIIAWFIAYMLNPLVNFLQTKARLKSRILSIISALLIVVISIAIIIAILAVPVRHQTAEMAIIVNNYMNGIDAKSILPDEWQDIVRNWLAKVDIKELVAGFDFNSLAEKSSSFIGSIVGTSINVVEGFFAAFIVLLYLIFILLDFDSLAKGFSDSIPQQYRDIVNGVLTDLSTGMSKYFRGQAVIASCVGVLFAIGFSIMGLPLGIVVGLLIGLFNMVPYLQTIGIPICMVLGLMQSAATGTSYWIILLEIAAIFIIVQAIQDLLLTPKIMGSTLGMKPAVMLLALSIWGSLLGVAGMIIALPLTTVIMSTYKRYFLKDNETLPDSQQLQTAEVTDVAATAEVTETKDKSSE